MSLISDHPSVESGTKHGDSRLVHRGAYLEDSHAFKGSGPSKRLWLNRRCRNRYRRTCDPRYQSPGFEHYPGVRRLWLWLSSDALGLRADARQPMDAAMASKAMASLLIFELESEAGGKRLR